MPTKEPIRDIGVTANTFKTIGIDPDNLDGQEIHAIVLWRAAKTEAARQIWKRKAADIWNDRRLKHSLR